MHLHTSFTHTLQEPYSLPMSRLEVLDAKAKKVTPVNVLQLFGTHGEYASSLGRSERLRVLLLRHLAPAQVRGGRREAHRGRGVQ